MIVTVDHAGTYALVELPVMIASVLSHALTQLYVTPVLDVALEVTVFATPSPRVVSSVSNSQPSVVTIPDAARVPIAQSAKVALQTLAVTLHSVCRLIHAAILRHRNTCLKSVSRLQHVMGNLAIFPEAVVRSCSCYKGRAVL